MVENALIYLNSINRCLYTIGGWIMILAEVCLLTNNVLRLSEFYKTVLNTTSDSDDEVH